MYLKCLYDNLADIKELDITLLSDRPNYLDQYGGLEVGKFYKIIGFEINNNFRRVYIIDGDSITNTYPDYFEFTWTDIPKDWKIRHNTETGAIEIFDKQLVDYDHWFERYLDDDKEIIEIINHMIANK